MTLSGHRQWMNKAVREELDIIVVILVHFKFSCAGMWPREVSQGELWGVPRHAAFSKGLWLVNMLVTWPGYWPLIGHYAGHVIWILASDWSLCWSRDLRREKADVWWSGHNADAGHLLMIYNVLHAPFINCIFGSQQHSSSQQHMSCILQDIVVVWYFSRLGLQCLMEIHNCFSEYWNPVPKI